MDDTRSMREDNRGSTSHPKLSPGRLSPPDILLLSRSDETWKQFQGYDNVADIALQGQWQEDNYRALLWRLLLNLIPKESPPSQWGEEVARKRDEYRRVKAEHRVDIAKVVDTNPMAANPLFSGTGDDPWRHFYERKEMMDTIKADLERLFPTGCGDYFLAPARQQLLLSVLSLWADVHPTTAYRQGMHEVLAPLVLVLEKEVARAASRATVAATPTGNTSVTERNNRSGFTSLNGTLLEASFKHDDHQVAAAMLGAGASSSEDLEADAYWMFTAVMDGLEGFYEHRVDAAHLRGRSRPASREVARGRGSRGGDRDGLDSPVVEMCKRLQGSRMQKVDPGLQRHLAAMDISPQLYGMKWARLLFGREFRVESVLRLWDHLFASAARDGWPDIPEGVEVVAVAMVMSIRDQLLAEDSTGCLQLLMRYPPDQNVSTVIDLALALGQPGGYTRPITSAPLPAAAIVPTARQDGFGIEAHGQPVPQRRPSAHSAVSPDQSKRRSFSSGTLVAESGPAWLIDGSSRAPPVGSAGGSGVLPTRRSSDMGAYATERRYVGGADGVALGFSGSGVTRDGSEDLGEMKNNWQHGLDQFTRRAISAAQGVAKLAVQTVERSQGEVSRFGQDGISEAEASALARRLRVACGTLEAGQVSSALHEMKQIIQELESWPRSSSSGVASRGADDRPRSSANPNSVSSDEGVQPVGADRAMNRAFSTYADDDGRSDGLYTRDL